MRGKLAAARNPKGQDKKNGHENGNGHGQRKPRSQRLAGEVLDGQPSVEQILTAPKPNGHELDKTMLLTALLALKKGNFSVRLPVNLEGIDGKIADAFNEVVELNEKMAEELERLSQVVGATGATSLRRWSKKARQSCGCTRLSAATMSSKS